MSDVFYTISDLMFTLSNNPTPVPPYSPFDWLANMALTQTGDFLGCLVIILAAMAAVSGLFMFARARSGKAKTISASVAVVLLAGICAFACVINANGDPEISKGVYTSDHIEIVNNIDGSN